MTLERKNKHLMTVLSLALFAAFVIFFLGKGLTYKPNDGTKARVGKQALDFQVTRLQGMEAETISLQDLKGKGLILNFWASWCVSCRQEALELESYWQEIKTSDLPVGILGIAIQDTEESALQFAKYYGKTYPLALDSSGNASIDYGVTGVPETFFIDKHGNILHKITGPVSINELKLWGETLAQTR